VIGCSRVVVGKMILYGNVAGYMSVESVIG
jgi:hypothetical protein